VITQKEWREHLLDIYGPTYLGRNGWTPKPLSAEHAAAYRAIAEASRPPDEKKNEARS
jgi:hypothetical protein